MHERLAKHNALTLFSRRKYNDAITVCRHINEFVNFPIYVKKSLSFPPDEEAFFNRSNLK